MVVAPFVGLVSEEVDLIVLLQKPEAVGLVPTHWEDVETDLPSDGILDPQVGEFLLQGLDECLPDEVLMVILLELFSFHLGAVPSNWRHVDQSRSVLNESASFHWNLEVGDVVQTEIDEFFERGLSQEVTDGLSKDRGTDFSMRLSPLMATSPF